MNVINEAVFQKPKAQDDKELEKETESLLNGKPVILETAYFNGKILDANIAPAVLIHGDDGDGVIHSRIGEGSIDILSTGPKTGSGKRILVLNDGRTGLVFRNVLLRRFISRDT